MSVTLRIVELKGSMRSLVLDYVPPVANPKTGKLQRFRRLKLYLYKVPQTNLEKTHNKETLLQAQTVCAQRQLDSQNKRFGLISEDDRNASFIEFFIKEVRKRQKSLSDNWSMGLRYFIDYASEDLRFPQLDDYLCEDYKSYLLGGPGISRWGRPIKRNTAVSYYAKFRAVLRIAYRKKLIPYNLHEIVPPISPVETHKERLTLEEFQLLSETPNTSELIARAALFSGLTGLRWSDVKTLMWGQIRGSKGCYELQFSQEKTAGAEVMPVSDEAISQTRFRGAPNQLVFEGLVYSRLRPFFASWLFNAGIEKKITFLSFRHTFATLQLELDTDIYTVSKLLGHKSIKNTEIYAKIVDKTKRTAAGKVMLNIPVAKGFEESGVPQFKRFILHRNETKIASSNNEGYSDVT